MTIRRIVSSIRDNQIIVMDTVMKARYKAIVDELALAIRSGRLAAGTQLPPHRQLASQRRISLSTATRVYQELEAMRLVGGEAGRGTFVRDVTLPPGLGIDQPSSEAGMLDLNFNSPVLGDQGDLLREALRQLAASGDIASLLRYQPHGGRAADRRAIADDLRRRRLTADPENVLIVSGAQHGLCVALMALTRPGDAVAVDALTYPGFKVLATQLNLELLPLPVTADGPDTGALAALCRTRRVRAVYTMPTLHNPLGWVMSASRRAALVAVARVHDLTIIEDAAWAFLEEDPPPPLAALAPERTIYVTGYSKNIATGLRVGALAAPAAYVPALERAIRATSWNTPALMSGIVSGWIADGTVSRLEAEKRREGQRRQQLVKAILHPLKPVAHPNAWYSWLPLGEDIRAEAVVRRLRDEGISLSGAEPFCTTGSPPHALRLALGSVSSDRLRDALTRTAAAIEYCRYL